MVDTPNLKVTHVEVGQLSKEATVNTGSDRFDLSNNDSVDVVTTAGGTIVVTEADYLDNVLLKLTGTPAGTYALDVPDISRAFMVNNTSGQTANVDTATGSTPVALLDGETGLFVVKGTVIKQIGASGAGGVVFGRQIEVWPASSMYFPTTQPAGTAAVREVTGDRPNVAYVPFISGSETRVHFGGLPFPNRYDQSTIRFQVGYTHLGTQTAGLDGVVWELKAVSIPDDGSFDVAFGTGVTVTLDRANGNDVHRTAESAVVTIAGTLGDGNSVFFQLARDTVDALDDLDIDAQLLWVRIIWDEDSAVDD